MTLARKLAHYAHSLKFNHLPKEAVLEVKRRVIDSLGAAVSAFHSEPGKITREISKSGNGNSTVIGTRIKTSMPLATFANGSLIRYWDYNDTYLSKEPAHPSDNLGAILSVAESEKSSGRDFITAAVLAYEVQCRLCDAASLRTRGWDHVTYGSFSAACGAGYLMRLTEEKLEHALGIAGVAGMALRQTRVGEISHWKAPAFANAARNAVFACELAKLGMTGPAPIFEGEKGFHKLVSGPFNLRTLGGAKTPFKILESYIKYYPVEYHAQAAVEAAIRLRPRLRSIANIQKIEVDTYDVAVEIIVKDPEKWKPKSRETADHSLPYIIARSLLDGKMTLNQFSDSKIHDPAALRLMAKMKIREDNKMTRAYPSTLPIRIKIWEKGAEPVEETVDIPRGHYKNPMTDREVEEKFLRLTHPFLSSSQQENILDFVWTLERQNNLNHLMKELTVSS